MLLFGGRKKLPIAAITNQKADFNTKYVPGSGVGGNSIAVRRAKLFRASTNCKGFCRNYETITTSIDGSSIPSSPTNFTGIAGDESVILSWTASTGASYYKISYTGFSFITSNTQITITGLTNNVGYIFSIVAVNSSGTSSSVSTSLITPFSAYGSLLFNGVDSYLSYSGIIIGTQAFTIDGWFYLTSGSNVRNTLIGASFGTVNGLSLFIYNNNAIRIDKLGVAATSFTFASTVATNTWYYFAIVRNSSNEEMAFLNTVASTTAIQTDTTNYAATSFIGTWQPTNGTSVDSVFPGNLSNIRIIVGTALYSPSATTITIPTPPITSTSETQLLLNTSYGSDYLVDSSLNNFTMTNNGGVVSSELAPF
jgi:hypothetical protein